MKIEYDSQSDIVHIELSTDPIIKDVSYGWNVNVGYGTDGIAEITILDAMANGYWPLEQFEPLHDVIRRMSSDEPAECECAAEELLLLIDTTQLKSAEVKRFVAHIQELGARVFARFPDGRELYLPISGFHAWKGRDCANRGDK
jgi:uncharacterized protein YuzE